MKRFAYYIACCSLVALFSCTHDDVDGSLVSAGDGKITIQSTLDDMIITRAADNKPERKITHIDVFAVDNDGAIVYYERNTTGNDSDDDQGKGKLTLGVARQAKKNDGSFYFAQGEEYSFVLVANAVANEDKMRAITSLDELELAVQDDSFKTNFGKAEGSSSDDPSPSMSRQTLLHLTGTEQGKNEGGHKTPQVFLMDAVATDSKDNTKWVVNSTTDKGNLNLSAEFKRAASKIIVNITQGVDVEFHTKLQEENTQYDFYKLPASTFVLPNQSKLVGLQLINTAPMGPNDETFIWKNTAENKIQVIGYAYSHSWSDVDLANETSLILNIPMKWNKDNDKDHTKEADAPRSWYKVPLSQGKKFERNMCYIVNVKINAVGAQSRSTAIKLEEIEYVTLDWVDVPISVGNSEERPKYLILNTDLVEMYNVNFDNTSLSFSSSSAITSVKLKDIYTQNANGTFTVAADSHSAYYINKFGIPTDLSAAVRNTISATPEWDVLNGNISILSPILKTTPEERTLALEALGERPENPTPVAAPSSMPEPQFPYDRPSYSPGKEYIDGKDRDVTTTTTTSYSYEGVGENIKFYKTTTVKKTYKSKGQTVTVSGYPQTTREEYVDEDLKDEYVAAYNAWVAENAEDILEYQQYLEAKAKYDAYNTAKTAIENSGNAAESHYNTIRYLEFEVTNADGLTATFRVMQYPVIYITNQQGWYSYREDFGSSYETKGDRNVRIRLSMTNNSWNGRYLFDTTAGTGYNTGTTYFWQSKVVSSYNDETGKSTTSFYSWSQNSTASTASVGEDATCETDANARMYHVRVTATSKDYTIGRPRLDSNDFTLGDAANSKLVSPSFMIASRLGAIYSSYGGLSSVEDGEDIDNDGVADRLEIFREHCKQYVEVYKDANGNPVKFDDWRLPTEKEIEIIISLQGTKDQDAPAIDYLLNGYYYMSASGPVYNSKGDNNNTGTSAIRCVRDAY